jgi:hypothetical protein
MELLAEADKLGEVLEEDKDEAESADDSSQVRISSTVYGMFFTDRHLLPIWWSLLLQEVFRMPETGGKIHGFVEKRSKELQDEVSWLIQRVPARHDRHPTACTRSNLRCGQMLSVDPIFVPFLLAEDELEAGCADECFPIGEYCGDGDVVSFVARELSMALADGMVADCGDLVG